MGKIREVLKEEIIANKYQYRTDFFELDYSKHALDRIKERMNGSLLVYPRSIRITEQNIVKGLLSEDGKYLFKVIIRLEFKRDLDIYLVIIPAIPLCKTVYFKKKLYGYSKTS